MEAMEKEWEMSIINLEPDVYVQERTSNCSACLARAAAREAKTLENTEFGTPMLPKIPSFGSD